MNSSPDYKNIWNSIYHAFFEEQIFWDIKLIFLWLILSFIMISIPELANSLIRTILILPIILFLPGYSLISAFFTEKEDLEFIERIALSFGLSLVIVPLIGLGLNYTPWGIRLDPIIISLIIFIGLMSILTQYRRGLIKKQDRFIFPFASILFTLKKDFFYDNIKKTDKILTIVLICSILLLIFTTSFLIVFPKENEKFTEFFILGEKLMAADYPTKIFASQDYQMYIGVGNYEYRNTSYAIEVYLINMTYDESGNTSYVSRIAPSVNFSISLSHNETIMLPYKLIANDTIYNRVEFLLFEDSIINKNLSFMEKINSSYRDLHLWIDVYPAEDR